MEGSSLRSGHLRRIDRRTAPGAPIVGMAPDNTTNGYWFAAADGGIFTFGGASYMGRVESGSQC